jgi:8-oxo-dGTP diphosphatase
MKSDKKKVGAGFGVMLLRDGRVLLGRRHDDPEKADSLLHGAGTWTMPGGKFEFGESFEDGAKRELMEETGIVLGRVKVICVNNDKVEDAHFVTVGFFSEYFDGEPVVMEPDEITEWHWFDLDDLPSPLFFPSERILENYMENKLYIKRD